MTRFMDQCNTPDDIVHVCCTLMLLENMQDYRVIDSYIGVELSWSLSFQSIYSIILHSSEHTHREYVLLKDDVVNDW